MHKIPALLAFILLPFSLFAQDDTKMNTGVVPPPAIVKPSRDFLMLQFNYINWISKPDTVKSKAFGWGFNGALCYDFPIKKTNLSFAAGLGVNVSSVYLTGQQIMNTDTAAATAGAARFVSDTGKYKRYKFVTAYLQAPFELRYFSNMNNRNKGFKAAIQGRHQKICKPMEFRSDCTYRMG